MATPSTTIDLINEAATHALANAMYSYTFGIAVDGAHGAEGKGLGSGIGVTWKGAYFILTADHVIQHTPYERMYFFLPNESLQIAGNSITSGPTTIQVTKRLGLEKPQTIHGEGDMAAILLPEQVYEQARNHFYALDEHHVAPSQATQVGVLGYPGDARVPVGDNFTATVYLAFGETGRPDPAKFAEHESQVAISYPTASTVDPHGLSGSGLWLPIDDGSQGLWSPSVRLIGLTTNHDADRQQLVGYKIERVIEFLRTEDRLR